MPWNDAANGAAEGAADDAVDDVAGSKAAEGAADGLDDGHTGGVANGTSVGPVEEVAGVVVEEAVTASVRAAKSGLVLLSVRMPHCSYLPMANS